VYRAFRSFPTGARLHTLIRFLTCPMLRVIEHVPAGGKLLDVGGGHGVFGVLVSNRVARVIAVEPDLRKVRPVEGVQFVIGYDDTVRGSFDAISILDVLYKIPMTAWDPLLARIAERLAPGGTLIIKEMDPTERLKNSWNWLQEHLVALVGLTLGEGFDLESPAAFAARLNRHGFTHVETHKVDRFYPHPHFLYIARR